jgi:SAM-dependent methyltransferase
MSPPQCRFCKTVLEHTFVDLGMFPLSNAYLREEQLNCMEPFYPLHARVCRKCFLVQLEEFKSPEEIFSEYAYFSSCSDTWLNHAREYAERSTSRFELNRDSLVVEIASNDGYLLQYFQAKGVPVLGVEPARNIASVAEKKGIRTIAKFFGAGTAQELVASGHSADLIIANNVVPHVPDLRDFISGLKRLLKPHGTIAIEVPHLLRLMQGRQFDTIYHEHFSYFSFCTAKDVLQQCGLTVYDVDEIPKHGGSLRIYACHAGNNSKQIEATVPRLESREIAAGFRDLATYSSFAGQVRETKQALLEFLISAKRAGKSIAAYGAPAKGNTLLNYCGVGKDFLDYTVDISPHKQNLFLPGTHIPIYHPDMLRRTRPDFVLILPWNLRSEILQQHGYVREWGGQFAIPVPIVEVIE